MKIAQIIDGKAISKLVREEIAAEVVEFKKKSTPYDPSNSSGRLSPTAVAMPYENGNSPFSATSQNPTPTKTMPWRNK
jgi:hypothetical protein